MITLLTLFLRRNGRGRVTLVTRDVARLVTARDYHYVTPCAFGMLASCVDILCFFLSAIFFKDSWYCIYLP